MGLPADASGAYRPNPQATTKLAPRPSLLKGYTMKGYTIVWFTFYENIKICDNISLPQEG
jgi:hypothetical protein